MPDIKITQWWIEPRDSDTNETISDTLAGLYSRECASESVECTDGKDRDMWRVPDYAFVARIDLPQNKKFNILYTY